MKEQSEKGQPLAGAAWLGIMTCFVGTLLAVGLVPVDVDPQGALRTSGIVMVISFAAVPMIHFVRSPRSIFRAEHIVLFGPIFWLLLDIVQGSYQFVLVDQTDVRVALLSIGLFGVAVWTAFLSWPWAPPRFVVKAARTEFPIQRLYAVAVASFLLGMAKYAIPLNFDLVAMFGWLGQGRWGAPWSRGQLGGWDSFTDHLSYFAYLLPTLTVLIARRAGWLTWRTVSAVAMSGIVTLFLADGGGRRIIGVVFGAAMVTFVLAARKVRLRHFIVVGGATVALLWVLSFMLDYRNVGYRAALSADSAGLVSRGERAHYHIDDNFLRLAQIIHYVPNYHPYVYHKYVIWVAVRPIPRVLWPGKPVNPGFDLPAILGMEGVSLSCSVVGELFGSGGLIAVCFGGWLFGRLAGTANQLLVGRLTASSVVLYSVALLALFSGIRSMLDLVLMSYPILAWVALLWFYRKFSRGSAGTADGRQLLIPRHEFSPTGSVRVSRSSK